MAKKRKPSHTALKVGLNIIALSNIKEMENILPNGIVDTTSELLLNAEAVSLKQINKHKSPKIVKLYKKFDWLLPGQFEAFGHRKAIFEKNVLDAIQEGATQVLVLGCGYDTLCYRLSSQYPKVKFFEIDHPITAVSKLEGIKKMGTSNNHYIIPEDLSKKTFSEVLGVNDNWSKMEKTIIAAEALLQYLPSESVKNLFEQCSKITGKDSRITFTYIGKGADGRPYAGSRSGLLLWLMKITGEPWVWSTEFDELIILLEKSGWKIDRELVRKITPDNIEYFAAATRN
jgi:methyltransferase (TIGR00027 family)